MGRLVQVRDVPETVHRTLKARAAQSGISLSEYLQRLRERTPVDLPESERPARTIRKMRGPLT